MSSVLQSLIACSAVCSTVSRRAGSSLSFHGAWSDRYLFASPTTRIASVAAAFCRLRASRSPTGAEGAATSSASSARSASVSSPGVGTAPTFFAAIDTERLTRLPQPATSSSLLRRQELRPGEVGVLVLRAGDGDEVAQRVGVVAGEEVAHVDDDLAATRRTCGPPW